MDKPTLKIDCKPGREGKSVVTVHIAEDVIACERVDMFDPKAREDLAAKIAKGRKGIDPKLVLTELAKAAATVAGAGPEEADEKEPQAAALVTLAEDDDLFHDLSGDLALAAVTIGEGDDQHVEIHPINGKGYRQSLARKFYRATKRPPNAQAMQDALNVLTGKAIHDGPARPTAIRIGVHEGIQFIDLADDRWRAVRLTPTGAMIVDRVPIAFLRKRGMQPLPIPDLSADATALNDLRPLMNAGDDRHWAMILSFMVGAMRPTGPYSALGVNGEQGSAKSTTCRMIRRIIDPNEADLRASPRDERDLIIAATNSWIVAFDNLSSITPQQSDAMCRISTNGGFSVRELYSDDGEKIFSVCRPQLINGIGDLLDQPDLLDRAIVITLPRIPDDRRRTESDVWREFERIRPRVFGALINATCLAMSRESSIVIPSPPRMADFARWIVAAEPALPVAPGSLLEAYRQNRADAAEIAVEASAVAAGVIELIGRRGGFDGSVGELLIVLNDVVNLGIKSRPDWPKHPKGLANRLRRVAPVLRRHGIDVSQQGRGEHGYRLVICRTSPGSSSASSGSSSDPQPDLNPAEHPEHTELRPGNPTTTPPRRKRVAI